MIPNPIGQQIEEICLPIQRDLYIRLGAQLAESEAEEHTLCSANDEQYNWKKMRISLDSKPENVEQSNVILIRHALAWHNYFKRIQEFPNRDIYNYAFLDPPLHYFGKRQCANLKQYVESIDFSVVYISPLLRTIQTTQQLFADHPKKEQIQFRLTPLCAEKVGSQYSVYKWGTLTALKQHNGNPINFDFSAFEGRELEFWQFEMLNQMDLIAGFQPNRVDQERFIIDKYVKQGLPISFESHKMTHERSRKFKELLRNAPNVKKIGIISHSVFLKYMLSNTDEKAEIKLENGSIMGINL